MSEKLTSTVWGIAPWSDELLKVNGDTDRGRANLSDYTQQLMDDFGEYHGALDEAGITFRSDWSGGKRDYFRGIVAGTHGFRAGITEAPVTRWFDTNTFYRQPTITGPLEHWSAGGHGYVKHFVDASDGPAVYQPTLLSPYAFLKLTETADGIPEDGARFFVSELYDQLLDDANAPTQEATHLLFHEPYAAYNQISEAEQELLRQSIDSLAKNHPGLNIGIYFSYGDGSALVRKFADDDNLSAIGCDLQKTPLASLPRLPEHRFIAGLVDGANTLLVPDERIALNLEETARAISPQELSLTHTVDLEHVPRDYALEKIRQIGRVVELVKGVSDE